MQLKCEKCNKIFYAAEYVPYCDECRVQILVSNYRNKYGMKRNIKNSKNDSDEAKELKTSKQNRKQKEELTFLERKNNMIGKIYYDWKVKGLSDDVTKLKVQCIFCSNLRESEVSKILNNHIPLCKCKNTDNPKIKDEKKKITRSKHTGVSWDNKHKKWRSQITYKNKSYNLGYFDNELDAAIMRLQAEKIIKENDDLKLIDTKIKELKLIE